MKKISQIWKSIAVGSIVAINGIGATFPPLLQLANSSVTAPAQHSLPGYLLTEYTPPAEGFGGTPETVGGGTRGGQCDGDSSTKPFLTPLMPQLVDHPDNYGTTVSASPQFFLYIHQTTASTAEFVLKDENEADIYRTTLPISGSAGILAIDLPEAVTLEVNQNYHWYFSLICDPENFRKNVEIDGWTRRIELDRTLATQLENADLITQSNIYGEAGIWYDAIAILAQLLQENPENAIVAQEWQMLLKSAGLEEFIEFPLTASSL